MSEIRLRAKHSIRQWNEIKLWVVVKLKGGKPHTEIEGKLVSELRMMQNIMNPDFANNMKLEFYVPITPFDEWGENGHLRGIQLPIIY